VIEGRRGDDEGTFRLIDLRIVAGLASGKTQAEIGGELHLEQPAISKLLRACEARTGFPLVEQVGRRLPLSAPGRDLAVAAERTLAAFDEVERLAEDLLAARSGTVRVMASSTPGSYVLPGIVAAFLREVPRAAMQLHIQPVSSLWAAFEAQRCDFAVVPAMGLPDHLVSEPLYNDPVVFFVSPDAPTTQRSIVGLDELYTETIVGKFVAAHWRLIVRELERGGFKAGKQMTIIPPEGVKRMVAAGAGIGMLLESSIRSELERGTVVRLPICDPSLDQLFCLARRPNDAFSPLALRFAAFLRSRIAAGFHAAQLHAPGEYVRN
jgi:DNA-binding transcriptional LysR family regulator